MVSRGAERPPASARAAPPYDAVRNRLLRALGEPTYELMRPHLQLVPLRKHQILQEANRTIQEVFFLEGGAASVLARTRRDGPVEVGIIGRFGMVGVPVFLGTRRAPHRCIVRIGGKALRIDTADFVAARERLPDLQRVGGQYVQAHMVQQSQVSLCNARHTISERLCRWLLLIRDRIESDTIPVTHDLLSQALGVRRAGVTNALARLEASGAIERGRARVRVRDVDAMHACACECYRIIQNEYEVMLHAGEEGAGQIGNERDGQ
jgi:CRP-like cAMP-binding protein